MRHTLNLERPIVFIDLETTGMNTTSDRIVQIGLVTAMPNGTVSIFEQKVNPEIPVNQQALEVHGLSNQTLKAYPTFAEVSKKIWDMLTNCDLGGFNILKFDLPVLIEEFKRVGFEFDITDKKIVDAQKIFHLMEPRTLSAALNFYCQKNINEITEANAHDASTDALATLMVLEQQINKYKGLKSTDSKGNHLPKIENNVDQLDVFSRLYMVDLMGRFVKNESGEVLLNFGKHKGKSLKLILKKEPHFYDWMMRGDFPADTKKHLTKIKMEMVQEQMQQ